MQTVPADNLLQRSDTDNAEVSQPTYRVEQFLEEKIESELLASALPDAFAQEVVERLKQEADRHWFIDPERSLLLADRIMSIGAQRGDRRQTALGMLARGNALKFKGQLTDAWDELARAGDLFLAADDETGWARTRITRLELSIRLNHVEQALAEAEQAREIFARHDNQDMLMRLHFNLGPIRGVQGDYAAALRDTRAALQIAESLGERGQHWLGAIHTNLGYITMRLGDYDQSLANFEWARQHSTARGELQNVAIAENNMAVIAQSRGQYRRALELYQSVLDHLPNASHHTAVTAKRDMIECYLNLNRFAEARALAQQVVGEARTMNDHYLLGGTLAQLATAEAELKNSEAALRALNEAETFFTALGAVSQLAHLHLHRARLALKQSQPEVAREAALAAAKHFDSTQERVHYASASLLHAQTLQALGDADGAWASGQSALSIAKKYHLAEVRHRGHLLLGQIGEARGDERNAMRRYQAAMATVDRVQRRLTITLRHGFLEDKNEAMHALIAMQLRLGQAATALETLERAKSQILLGYLLNRERLRWGREDARSKTLIEDLGRLRAEHYRLYRTSREAHGAEEKTDSAKHAQMLDQIASLEQQMRARIEQLYIRSDDERAVFVPATPLGEVQRTLDASTTLVEYYNDGTRLWAFVLDGQTVRAQVLPVALAGLNTLLAQWQSHVAAALQQDPHARPVTLLAQRLLRRFHAMLIEPLALNKAGIERLIVVPYGVLHYVPLHLLYDGSGYLIDGHEVVTLPAAALATRRSPAQRGGALTLTHSWGGRLPHTQAEGQLVQRLFDGELFSETEATRATLQAAPEQILHIAAHGEHRLDQPDLSYIELGDGQMFADDLLQQDLSYELVTLSACETGSAKVAASEELIGLGRGFLYAGAGSLLVSLWPVADNATLQLMESFYRALRAGETKAAALRGAQRAVRAEDPFLHPAYWGAFELIGDAGALSVASIQLT